MELNRPKGGEEHPLTPETHTFNISTVCIQPKKGKEETLLTLNPSR